MANPSFSVPDEVLERFDDAIFELKAEGELPRDTSRSEILRQLMEEWIEEHEDQGNSNSTHAAQTAD